MEKLVLVSTQDIATKVLELEFSEGFNVEVHNTENEDSLDFTFRLSKQNFLESDILLCGGYGLYTTCLSVNNGIETKQVVDFIGLYIYWQNIERQFLKIRTVE